MRGRSRRPEGEDSGTVRPEGHLTENVKLRLDRELLDALERLAHEGDRTVAAEMRRGLRRHVQLEVMTKEAQTA